MRATSTSLTRISATWPETSSGIPERATISPAVCEVEALDRVDVLLDQCVGVGFGDRLDVHPAHAREHHQQLLLGAVEDDRGVVLGLDFGADLDPEFVDLERPFAVWADDVHADDVAGVLVGLGAVLGDLDAAGLAAASDQNLRLDGHRVAELFGGGVGLISGCRVASFGNGKAMTREQFFSLIFE